MRHVCGVIQTLPLLISTATGLAAALPVLCVYRIMDILLWTRGADCGIGRARTMDEYITVLLLRSLMIVDFARVNSSVIALHVTPDITPATIAIKARVRSHSNNTVTVLLP